MLKSMLVIALGGGAAWRLLAAGSAGWMRVLAVLVPLVLVATLAVTERDSLRGRVALWRQVHRARLAQRQNRLASARG